MSNTSIAGFFKPPVTGLHVFVYVTLFFIVVGGVNIVYVVVALNSWSGLSTDNAYNEGVAFNTQLEAKRTQQELGWRSALHAVPSGEGLWALKAEFRDRYGNPLPNLTVQAIVRRPTHEGYDQEVSFTEEGAGQYSAPISLALMGQWDVQIKALQGDSAAYYAERRIWIK